MPKPTISVLGCGWLGFPLSKFFHNQHYIVKGSTTSREKLAQLNNAEILPYFINLSPHINHDIDNSFFQSDILVLTIPFSRQFVDPRFYFYQIESVLLAMANVRSSIRKIIFTSSTMIYPNSVRVAAEDIPIHDFSARSSVLRDVEQLLLAHATYETIVLRLAGLYSDERKLGRFFSGQSEIANGDSPVNLVHLDDCIGVISAIIEAWPGRNIFNVCADKHPARREIYSRAMEKLGLPKPRFLNGAEETKIVTNDKIKMMLKYSFKHSDPLMDVS